jgi:hypothetical protein
MQDKLTNPPEDDVRRALAQEHDTSNYQARLKAAGLDGDDPEDISMDEFRERLARRIAMFMNEWDGCAERICQRNRGCMAPNGDCVNVEDDVEMSEEEWAQCRFDIRQALDERMAELGLKDG